MSDSTTACLGCMRQMFQGLLGRLHMPLGAAACRTLRDVLDAGPLEDADRWRVLRQILAGLAHIHSQVRLGVL